MAKNETGSLTNIDFIIGMPPITTVTGDPMHSRRSAQAVTNTMPQATIYPGVPSFQMGMDLFKRVPAFEDRSRGRRGGNQKFFNKTFYHPMLKAHGFSLDSRIHDQGLQVAYIADNFPTDTFTNEYGENFLQKFTDVASEGAASLAQMFGVRNALDIVGGAAGKVAQQEGKIGDFVKSATGYIKDLAKSFESASGMANVVGRLAAGSRIDFPMIWKTSSFQPSYTMTVRLYNPNPGSVASTRKYIIGPIAALMLLGIPISEDSSTYSWPFLHRVWSKGIYDLDPAYIQNITVIKGGDQQQISWRQSLSMVDVRIDFGSLFSTMLAGKDRAIKTRPTLRKYLAAMEGQKDAYSITGGNVEDPTTQNLLNSRVQPSSRNLQGPTKSTSALDADEPSTPSDRVSQQIKDIADELEALIPDGFRIST